MKSIWFGAHWHEIHMVWGPNPRAITELLCNNMKEFKVVMPQNYIQGKVANASRRPGGIVAALWRHGGIIPALAAWRH